MAGTERKLVMPPNFEPLHGQSNWITWKLAATLYFGLNGLKGYLDGTKTAPAAPAALGAEPTQAQRDAHERAVLLRERYEETCDLVKFCLTSWTRRPPPAVDGPHERFRESHPLEQSAHHQAAGERQIRARDDGGRRWPSISPSSRIWRQRRAT